MTQFQSFVMRVTRCKNKLQLEAYHAPSGTISTSMDRC